MKKAIKIANIILVISLLMLCFSNTVFAAGDLVEDLKPDYDDPNAGQVTSLGQTIINWISIAGIVIAVVVLVILGIKYMIGSASEKAEYKKTMIPYLVGAILVFGASSIAQVIINVTSGLTATN